MYDTVQAGLFNGDVESLQKIYEDLLNRVRVKRGCGRTDMRVKCGYEAKMRI